MSAERFEGLVLPGHKEDAVEVPFDPAQRWSVKQVRIGPGRRGYPVEARIGGHSFRSHVVVRSGRHWLLLPRSAEQGAGVCAGSRIEVLLRAAISSA